MKKIVVITGSPRKKGNSNAMAEAFIREAESLGHSVSRFDAARMELSGCSGCETCFKTGRACSFDDDFNEVAPVIQDADAVIFAMPVYWFSIPAQIKCILDKMYSFYIASKSIEGKACGLLACCADDDDSVFEGVSIPIKRSAELLKWYMNGEVLIKGVSDPGDIHKTDGCERSAELARKLLIQ